MFDQSLWHRGIDPVHRHVVPIVGAPAEGQLRKVSSAHDQAVLLVRYVHQDLSPLTRLRVLISRIHHCRIMPYVPEMLLNSGDNRDLPGCYPKGLHQVCRIGFGPDCRPESGHSDADYSRAVQAQLVEGHRRDYQRQSAVKTSGYSQNGFLASDVLHAGRKAGRLDREDLLASLRFLGGIAFRQERMRLDFPVKTRGEVRRSGIPDLETVVEIGIFTGGSAVRSHSPEGVLFLAVDPDLLDVDVGECDGIFHHKPLIFSQ